MTDIGIFRLRPWFRTRVWGARDLSPWYDFKVGEEPIGEVWLSGDTGIVDSGPLAGQIFSDVFRRHAKQLVGDGAAAMKRFPLLMKVLFPQEKLSVQVHPGDAMAREEGEPHGKTECWYVLAAKPSASVALGLKPETSMDQVKSAIEANTLESLLHWIPVRAGDTIFVDAGTIHAIAPGAVLLETQQNSDMTYRLYDYGRPRELHLEKGLQAARVQTDAGKVAPRIRSLGGDVEQSVLIETKYFRVERFRISNSTASKPFIPPVPAMNCVQLIFAANGSGTVGADGGAVKRGEAVRLRRGELAIIPACVDRWNLLPDGPMEILRAIPL